jgi:ketosteroid isomerase-like protein
MTACPIEDRLALEDLTIAYAHAVDSMTDVEGIAQCFTEDADYDLTGIGFPKVAGRAGIRALFTGIFAGNAHHAHFLSNFAVTAYGGDTASVRTYVQGMGRGKDGSEVVVYGRYYFDAVRTAEGWRFARYTMDFLIPPAPASA